MEEIVLYSGTNNSIHLIIVQGRVWTTEIAIYLCVKFSPKNFNHRRNITLSNVSTDRKGDVLGEFVFCFVWGHHPSLCSGLSPDSVRRDHS